MRVHLVLRPALRRVTRGGGPARGAAASGGTEHARRGVYLALAAGTIAVGLLVHLRGGWLAPAARDVAGDALWAAMMLWWLGALAPRAPLGRRAVGAYGVAAAVELSQLARAPWLDAARHTLPGRLVLGSGFDPRDLASYAAGVAGAAALDAALLRRRRRRAARAERAERLA